MKPAPFQYRRMTSLDELLAALAEHGDAASILAGGQSLVPLMNLRMARPDILLDINRIDGLSGIRIEGERLVIGALTRHAAVAASPEVRAHAPLIAEAMRHVAHEAVRNRGTFGGSVSLADPAAELPACCVALDARFELVSKAGRRSVPAAEFFLGPYETARVPDEVLVAARIPVIGPDERSVFMELSRRQGDFALAGLAAHAQMAGDRIAGIRLVWFGVADRPVRAPAAEAVLTAGPVDEARLAEAAAALGDDLDPIDDPQTSGAARLQLARTLLKRAVSRLTGR